MGPMANIDCEKLMQSSPLFKKYQTVIDPISAYEMLTDKINEKQAEQNKVIAEAEEEKRIAEESKPKPGEKSLVEKVMDATITRQIGKEIVRGIFGMITGKKTRKGGGLFGF